MNAQRYGQRRIRITECQQNKPCRECTFTLFGEQLLDELCSVISIRQLAANDQISLHTFFHLLCDNLQYVHVMEKRGRSSNASLISPMEQCRAGKRVLIPFSQLILHLKTTITGNKDADMIVRKTCRTTRYV